VVDASRYDHTFEPRDLDKLTYLVKSSTTRTAVHVCDWRSRMQRAGFVLPIQPGKVDEYVVAHANVWPDMRDAISDSGIQNYTIYQYGNLAIGYLESDDVAASFEALSKTDVNARWQEAMAGLLESKVDDDGPAGLTEIFHLD